MIDSCNVHDLYRTSFKYVKFIEKVIKVSYDLKMELKEKRIVDMLLSRCEEIQLKNPLYLNNSYKRITALHAIKNLSNSLTIFLFKQLEF